MSGQQPQIGPHACPYTLNVMLFYMMSCLTVGVANESMQVHGLDIPMLGQVEQVRGASTTSHAETTYKLFTLRASWRI